MAKAKRAYACNDCGADFPRWQGQCNACGAWNTISEFVKPTNTVANAVAQATNNAKKVGYAGAAGTSGVQKLSVIQKQTTEVPRYDCGMSEFNRVLGGGLVHGGVLLLSGSPGAGKSTILLQTVDHLAPSVEVLYCSGEESLIQIADRATRLKLQNTGYVNMLSETNVQTVISTCLEVNAKILVVDSIQTMYSDTSTSSAGSVSQIKECGMILTQFAKLNNISVMVIGHVTKDGTLAGPKVLEHTIDTVVHIDTTTADKYRTLKVGKNRFGTANEMCVFMMTSGGMKEVKNPSAIFLQRPDVPTPGSVVLPYKEGNSIILLEIQALLAKSNPQHTKRVSVGLDSNRNSMLLAVLNSHCGVKTYDHDSFFNVVGGMKISETSSDLALILAIISALSGKVIPQDVVVMGEVGLGGEVRPVANGGERLKEAFKHGFHRAIIPASNAKGLKSDMEVISVKTVHEAIAVVERF
nr:DNA repair protein RadA [Vibrio splendidus]MCC4883092.1 DNA repair protein RadA [Vibrio splendidus]